MQPTLSLLVLRSAAPERLAAFYAQLGIAFEKHRHGSGPEHFSAVLGGLVFEIYPLKEGEAGTRGLRMGFAVTDVEGMFAQWVEAGGTAVVPPKMSEWGLRAVLDDPEGHRIELTQAK
ncbi:MAG TPA: VOC family protein [Prosthecobacter sp.]